MVNDSQQSGELSLPALRELLAECATQGLADIDPLRFYYLQALLENLSSRQHLTEGVSKALLAKAASLIRDNKQSGLAGVIPSETKASEQIQNHSGLSKLKALNLELSQRIGGHSSQKVASEESTDASSQKAKDRAIPKPELQAYKQYQQLFEKMAVERLLSKVMHEIPENAGPLNPERVVIRCLSALQEISPAYAMRLLGYYESLISLRSLPVSEK